MEALAPKLGRTGPAASLAPVSISNLNTFRKDPARFIVSYVYGKRGEDSIYAARGRAVETGFDAYCDALKSGSSLEKSVGVALGAAGIVLDQYAGQDDSSYELTTRSNLKYYIQSVVDAIPSEHIVSRQKDVRCTVNGLPMSGRYDYKLTVGDFTEIVDLKTATKMPGIVTRGPRKGFLSKEKQDNARQAAFYKEAEGVKETGLLFVCDDGVLCHYLEGDEYKESIDSLKELAGKVKRLLALPLDLMLADSEPKDLKGLSTDFYWSHEQVEAAYQLWGY